MPKTLTLTIRQVPEQVVGILRQRARAAGRSMQQEILTLLTRETLDRESALEQIRQLRARHLREPMSLETIEAAIDEGRP